MELCGELDLSLDLLIVARECHLCELHAKLVFASLLCLVLVLHIWVHVTIEKLRVVFVSQLQSHSLVWCTALSNQFVICNDQILKDSLVKNLDFHF